MRSALGGGISGDVPGTGAGILPNPAEVYALAVDDSGNLFVGGRFTNAGDIAANNIAKWDGSTWSEVGGGMNGSVLTLAVDRYNNCYLGGEFTIVGGKVSAYIAQCKLPPSSIRPRDSGTSHSPRITCDSRSGCIHFHLTAPTVVDYRIFTLAGKEVVHGEEYMPKGKNSLNIKEKRIGGIARGTYIAQVKAGGGSMRFRMMVEK